MAANICQENPPIPLHGVTITSILLHRMIIDQENTNCYSLKSSSIDLEADISLVRCESTFENLSERFKCGEKDFSRQYAYTYASRLKALREPVRRNCAQKWGNEIPIRKLSELAELKNERCIIIGTIFKRQDLIPSILKEISEENQLLPQPKVTNYVSPSDQLILEDEIQRIPLVGKIDPNEFVSGVVLAVLGMENQDGNFEVEDFVSGCRTASLNKHDDIDDRFVLLVSGLDIGGTTNMLSLQLLTDWVNGELGCPNDQNAQSKICRVIIAGNSIKKSQNTSNWNVTNSAGDDNSDIVSSIKQLDKLLLELVKTVDVDIMPGEFDPSNHTLPQQPFHHCLLPNSSKYETLHRTANPYECLVDGRRILGTAGQPVNDIKSLTLLSNDLIILENTLRWSHLAPTAPDTLACYPFYQEDPFVITQLPDIYFTGNSSSFDTKLIQIDGHSIRLICLPVFSQTQMCALLNLKTLDCTPLQFNVFDGSDS